MNVFGEGLLKAIQMLVTLDPEILEITWRTIQVSTTATLISVIVGVPIGTMLALRRFRTRGLWVSIINFGMGLPPAVVGLVT